MTDTEQTPVPFYCAVAGPTASGKSSLAMSLARTLGGEIVNCDSVQLYRGLDIGSAKPGKGDQQEIPHHLIDILEPGDEYDAARFAGVARDAIRDIASRGRLPVVVGGSGLYLRFLWGEQFHDFPHDPALRTELASKSGDELYELLKQEDPRRAAELHRNDQVRVSRALELCRLTGRESYERNQFPVPATFAPGIVLFLNPPKDVLLDRIALRSKEMLRQGLQREVETLLKSFPGCRQFRSMQSIGYKQVLAFLAGDIKEEELLERIIIATRQYAKRQKTWFRKIGADVILSDIPYDVDDVRSRVEYAWHTSKGG